MDHYRDKGRQTVSSMFSSPPPVWYHGLINQGATCYLNSVLQVLFMTEDFRAAVESLENPATGCIDRQLKDLFDDLKGQTADTYKITRKLGIHRVYEQQDAAEYYEKILSLTSPDASQIFHGWLTDRTTCSACGTQTDTDGAFWHLPLALVDSYSEHYSVVDGIKEHFRASEFSGENQMYCEQCDAKCDATIQCVMKRHPEVLMLLLKRFDFDYSYMTYVKINQTVDVPRTIQIPENQTYELYAFVDHSGDLRSGHYSSTIWDDKNWFTFNDSKVILADYQPFQVDNFEKSRSAYLLFYRKKNATQPPSPVSAPGGHQPATIDDYDQCKDLGKKRGREEGEAIDRDERKKRVKSKVELQPDPHHYDNDQDTIPHIHQVCNEERNDKNHLQDAQAEEHRDEGEILTDVKKGKGGNAEAENEAEKMEPLRRVTEGEASVDDQSSGKEGTQDFSDDLRPEINDMLAKDAHLRKEVERSDEERGVIVVKTGENQQSEKEEKSLTNYPEDNLRGPQEVGHVLKPVSEDEQRDERGVRTDDREGKVEAGERGITSEIGKPNHDNGGDGGSKRNMPKHDHQHREERMDVQEVEEEKKGDDKHAQRMDTSVMERYPRKGVQAQDSGSMRRDDVSVPPEQKIQNFVELDRKGKTEVHERRMGSGPTNIQKISDPCRSNENQDYRRDNNNKQKMTKDDQRCKEGGSSRREGHEQEREVRRDVEEVAEQKGGDSEQPQVGLHDRQRMPEQRIRGTCTNHKDGSAETQSKHIQNRPDSSHRRAGSPGSRKHCTKAFPESTGEERSSSKNIENKKIDKEIHSETAVETSVEGKLSQGLTELNVSESPHTESKNCASQKAVENVQDEETNSIIGSNNRNLSDTEDQEGKNSCLCGLYSRPKKTRSEKEGKKKRCILS